jgi:hypothetical protein
VAPSESVGQAFQPDNEPGKSVSLERLTYAFDLWQLVLIHVTQRAESIGARYGRWESCRSHEQHFWTRGGASNALQIPKWNELWSALVRCRPCFPELAGERAFQKSDFWVRRIVLPAPRPELQIRGRKNGGELFY